MASNLIHPSNPEDTYETFTVSFSDDPDDHFAPWLVLQNHVPVITGLEFESEARAVVTLLNETREAESRLSIMPVPRFGRGPTPPRVCWKPGGRGGRHQEKRP
jgi:hypothetical protein